MSIKLTSKQNNFIAYGIVFIALIMVAPLQAQKKKEVPFDMVDEAPLFIACEKRETEEERKQCVKTEINKVVHGNFNYNLGKTLNLTGQQRVVVLFKFGKYSGIKDIQVRAPHPDLKAEAERVVKLLPKFTPGRHKRRNVEVLYTLPIMFNVLPEEADN